MSKENEFRKPQPRPVNTLGLFKLAANNADMAREMVSLHLQGRNPQRRQISEQIHARAGRQPEHGRDEAIEKAVAGMSDFPRPNLDLRAKLMPLLVLQGKSPKITVLSCPKQFKRQRKSHKMDFLTNKRSTEVQTADETAVFDENHAAKSTYFRQATSTVSVPAKSHIGPCKNPQCHHCGTVIIPSPKASFPYKETPSISVNDWSIYTTKGPICLSDELDHLNDTRFDFPLPEMIFGSNSVRVLNEKTGASIEFNTLDALDSLAPNADFKVAYYKEWLSTRPKAKSDVDDVVENEVSEVGLTRSGLASEMSASSKQTDASPDLQSVKPYDWTYSTNYKGTLANCKFVSTTQDIPLEKLVRQDPILFFDESILFEDELGDNGISMLSTKIRVMPLCLLLLCRFSMRVDDVAFRIRDTRVYVDLETNVVLREYKVQQALYGELLGKVSSRSSDPKKLLRDLNWVSKNTPVTLREMEIMEQA
ncbi:hypothetical protein HF325_001000 [Metschnikowia pulcherrima]|uniref:Type 2A phosphatase activator TIP41 n=1 Tax=Metschnikowia pulcherrima TaxID=27326 RepID=A0A8H7H1D5_9ASCO|nr:hypothetical protein HF325_001000 [Metschnikowia pulcherrima]